MISIQELSSEDDLPEVLALCRDFFAEYEDNHERFFDTDNLTDADISGRFLASIGSDIAVTLVARDGDRIVGYILLALRDQPRLYKVKKIGVIPALMIAEDHRRRGIGTRLLEEARVRFARHGIRYFTFYTSVANTTALRLYEKTGMTPLQTVFLGET